MKLKTLLCGLVAGVVALAAGKASAFPLNLVALSGTITSTAVYGNSANTTTNKAKVVAVNLKQVLTVVSNEISLRTSGTNAPPANSRIAFDQYTFQIYVTNNTGYFYDISAFARVRIDEIATNFRQVGENGGSENDVLTIQFYVYGRGTDGLNYEFSIKGRGAIVYSVNGTTHKGTMIFKGSGSDYGEYKSSGADGDGVTTGSVVFSGSGTPEWEGPFSVFWWNN